MKIKNVRLEEKGAKVRLVAHCKIRKVGWDEVFFEFDKKYRHYIPIDASPFVAALTVPSMRYGEDLIVDSEMSAELYQNMQQLMQIMIGWEELRVRKINIRAKSFNEDRGNPKWVSTSFSAGVDSFYTFLKHRSGPDKVTHLIVVDGFDIDLRNRELWKETVENVRAVGEAEGVEVIEVKTNVKELLEPIISWEDSCGGGLAAVPMCLRGGIRLSYLPSGFSAEQQFPSGSNLAIDHLWSTENFKFVHDGAEARRVDKVMRLVGSSPLALQHLRVCHDNVAGVYNCGKCDKCFRTMVSLKITGTFDKAETFPKEIDIERLKSLRVPSHYAALFHQENLDELKKRDIEPEIQQALRKILGEIGQVHSRKDKWIGRAMYLDHAYSKGLLRRVARPVVGNRF